MKVLFVHDATFKYDEDMNYYGTSVNPKTMSRYLFFSEDIDVLIRTAPFKKNEDKSRYTKITDNFNVISCPKYMSIKGFTSELKNVKKQVEKLVAEADIVFTRFSGTTGMLAAKEAQKQGKCYVIESVGCPFDSFWNYNLKGKIIAPFLYLITKKRIKVAPYVVYVTSKFLQRRYPTDGRWISASNVEIEKIDQNNLVIREQKITNRDVSKPIILGTAGAIDVPGKGHAYVIEAMARLKKEGINFEYRIIGTGNKDRLEAIAKKHSLEDSIKFMGVLKQEDVLTWVDELDIYVQPSDQEGLPRALIEAMSRACPAIGSSTAGIPELLDDSCIFTRKNINELYEILKAYDTKKMKKQSVKNFNEASKYLRSTIYSRREAFYESIKAEHPELINGSDGE